MVFIIPNKYDDYRDYVAVGVAASHFLCKITIHVSRYTWSFFVLLGTGCIINISNSCNSNLKVLIKILFLQIPLRQSM